MRTEPGILEAVEHRCIRSAAAVHEDLAQPLGGLASVAATAFFFGIIGNVVGIVGSFQGSGEKSALMAAQARLLSESMCPTAFSLFVGLVALGFYRYLSHRVAICDLEMQSAMVDLIHH